MLVLRTCGNKYFFAHMIFLTPATRVMFLWLTIIRSIPNQNILINAISLLEAKDNFHFIMQI